MANIDELSASSTIANATTSGNTELAVVVLGGVAPARPGSSVLLFGYMSFTTGANITSARLRIERGAVVGGTAVADTGVDPAGIGASAIATKTVMGVDATPGDVANASYTLTLTTAGGSPGNSTIQFATLVAIVFR